MVMAESPFQSTAFQLNFSHSGSGIIWQISALCQIQMQSTVTYHPVLIANREHDAGHIGVGRPNPFDFG
jgi:hypothetical protein